MKQHRMMVRAIPAIVAALVSASAAGAQQTLQLYSWNGPVDKTVDIVMHGSDVSLRGGGFASMRAVQGVARELPRVDGYVTVRAQQGRGAIDVLQQPNASNDYTTIVRIRDDAPGADNYRLTAYWAAAGRGNGGYNDRGNGGYTDRGNGGYNDDRRGDDRRRDDDRGRGNNGYNDARGSLHWSGAVDDVVNIRIQGARIDYPNATANGVRDVRTSLSGNVLPRREVNVVVRQKSGRGSVYVVQQPTARNGYTAIIQIHDPRGGFGAYDLDVSW